MAIGEWHKPKIHQVPHKIGACYVKSLHRVLPLDYLKLSMNEEELRRYNKATLVSRSNAERGSSMQEVIQSYNGRCPYCGISLPNSLECECGYRGQYINPSRANEPHKTAKILVPKSDRVKVIESGNNTLIIEE